MTVTNNKLNKVLSTLSIASSDTREESIKSIIISTLYESIHETSYDQMVESIDILYDVQLYELELKEVLKASIDNGAIVQNIKGYKLSAAEKSNFEILDNKIKSEERKRYINFKTFLDDNYDYKIVQDNVKELWEVFRQYLYNCFFHYGEKAVEFFHPNNENRDFQNSEMLNEAFDKLKTSELQDIFKKIIDDFPDHATQEDIDFVNDLGQKALCFASLGLEPELAKEQLNFSLVDWTLYLDTNFLFSILNLHINVENDASKELLKLIFANPEFIKVQFRYSELTLKELRSKQSDFISLESDLTKSGIKALLESDELDSFSRRYYRDLLDHPNETLHPNQIIDLAEVTLDASKIVISRNKRQAEHLGEKYIAAKVQDYYRYIGQQNELRDDFNAKSGVKPVRNYYRSDSQLYHDITLRELIINSRDTFKTASSQTLNEVKYFGITLDDLLIKFDSYELRKGDIKYPTFFKPSFLLNKLIKILPIKTDNYKRAFIKAVSSRGFNKDPRKSEDIIKIVNYLKTLGIDDKKVLLNLITEKLFVERFKQNENSSEEVKKAFVESEINKFINQTSNDLELAERKINVLEEQTEIDETAKNELYKEKERISEDAKNLKNAVEMLHKKVKRLEKTSAIVSGQSSIDFEAEQKNKKIEELAEKLKAQEKSNEKLAGSIKQNKRKEFEKQTLKKWRLQTWRLLVLSVFVLICFIVIMFYNSDWDITKFDNKIKTIQGHFLTSVIIGSALLFFNALVITVLVLKYYNHSNINAFTAKIEYPESLKD
ncbi:MAG: hypothetical protein ABIN91_02620 [Mucilaginibacter sp.]|uniref:hypothetical protein n=1 Tax=Mucilaginibacter sp. TaxID=1882438 RepID=UPI003266B4DC